jgi:hypothetical protein
MGVKDMFYKGYSEEEVRLLPGVMAEEIKKLDAYEGGECWNQDGCLGWFCLEICE